MGSYELVRTSGPAAALHHRELPDPVEPVIWWHEITSPALVLGSTVDDAIVDRAVCRERGVEVIRRRSGGGAVLLVPGQVTWFDVIIPSGADGWATDIHAPMVWVGRHLVAVLSGLLDRGRLAVHDGALVSTSWSRTICFDGLGPGEVLLDGAKLVGVSQRRTRDAARLQVSWYTAHEPAALVELLRPEARPPLRDLRPVATLDAAVSAEVPARLAAALNDGPAPATLR